VQGTEKLLSPQHFENVLQIYTVKKKSIRDKENETMHVSVINTQALSY